MTAGHSSKSQKNQRFETSTNQVQCKQLFQHDSQGWQWFASCNKAPTTFWFWFQFQFRYHRHCRARGIAKNLLFCLWLAVYHIICVHRYACWSYIKLHTFSIDLLWSDKNMVLTTKTERCLNGLTELVIIFRIVPCCPRVTATCRESPQGQKADCSCLWVGLVFNILIY